MSKNNDHRKNIVYFQGGGPTSVINSSLYGLIGEARKEKMTLFGSLYGVDGLINDDLIEIKIDEDVELLLQTPGAALGSSRHRLTEGADEFFEIEKTLIKHDIGYVICNGGNDTMDTGMKLYSYFINRGLDIKVIGIPKTIDNDLEENDFSLGFPSAARYVANAVKSISADASSYKKGKVIVVEMMGRDTGWLAASSMAIGEKYKPDLLLIPEMNLDLRVFLERLKDIYLKKGYAIIAIGEGINLPRNNSIEKDSFGHDSLEGTGLTLCSIIKKELGLDTRFVQLSVLIRSFTPISNSIDRDFAISAGKLALKSALDGENGKLLAIKKTENSWRFENVELSKVANKTRKVPSRYIKGYENMDDEFITYIKSLLGKDENIVYKHGIVEYFDFKNRKN